MNRKQIWNGERGTRAENRQNIKGYLLSRGIPPQRVNYIIAMMASDAMEEGKCASKDRIYAVMTLILHDQLGFGPKRTLKFIKAYDNICASVMGDEGRAWEDILQEVRDKTGFVIRTDEQNRVVYEYNGTDADGADDVEEVVGDM